MSVFRSRRGDARRAAEASYAVALATCQRAATGITPDQLIGSSRYGGSSSFDADGRQRALSAQEQLGHFRGEVYTSIRPIMERLAGRAIRLARVPGRGKKKGNGKTPSHFVQKWFHKSSLLAGGAEAREVEIIDQHPVLDAIHDPAPSIVGWTNWHLKIVSIASLCCTGYAYWWFPVVNGRTEIWYLPPDWVWPRNDRDKLNVAWEIRPPHAEKYEVPRESIAPFWFPDPANPLQGLGQIEAGARGVLISEFLEECQKRHFQLGPHPTAVVTLGGLQTKEGQTIRPRLKQWQINQIRDAFDMRYANVFNAGRTVVLDALIDKFEPWSNQPHTMSYGENADTARRRVRQNFGTSDYAVGEGSLGSRAESAESDYHFCENTLNPKCELLSRVLTGCVLPVFDDDPSLILFIEPCEPHDSEQKAADYQFAAKTGIININDFLVHRLGMEPVAHGENYLVPTSYTVRTPNQMADGFTAAPAAAAAGQPGLPSPITPATSPSTPQTDAETPEDMDESLADGEAPAKSFPRAWLLRGGPGSGPHHHGGGKVNVAKRAKAIATHKASSKEKQDHAEASEHLLVKKLRMKKSGDNKPMDLTRRIGGKMHGVECKTLMDNKNNRINMHVESRKRKEGWAKKNKATNHVVALDHRDRFAGGKNKDQYSGHEIYYRRGAGAYALSQMHKAKSWSEVRRLMVTPTNKLPPLARP